MRHAGWSSAAGGSTEPSGLDRRKFLSLGAGCAVPLLVGGTLGAAAGTLPAAQEVGAADPVLDLVTRELLRTYHEIAGATSIRGEHARTAGAHIDVLVAHLQARKHDRRLDDELRRRIHDRGRDATARDLTSKCRELATTLSLEHGVILRVGTDDRESLAALDAIVAPGVVGSLRGCGARLRQLGAMMDRAALAQHPRPISVVWRQKPGDDFLGYPPPEGGLTWCQCLMVLAGAAGIVGAILGGVAWGVGAAVLQAVGGAICQQMDVP